MDEEFSNIRQEFLKIVKTNDEYDLTPEEECDYELMLYAMYFSINPEDFHPKEVEKNLISIHTEYGCWLQYFWDALEQAVLNLPVEYEPWRFLLKGAFHMASAFLFELQRHRWEPRMEMK